MASKVAFHGLLKTRLSPLLREHGFRGSGSRFYRLDGDVLHVVELRAGGGGAGVYVNLGVHHMRLGLRRDAAKDVRQLLCPFRKRLHDFAANDLFLYDGDNDEVETTIRSLTEALKTEGFVFFDAFGKTELARTIKGLAKWGCGSFPSLDTPAPPSTWAKLAKALGDATSAKAFSAQAQALAAAAAEDRRRQSVIDDLVATHGGVPGASRTITWHSRTLDCVREACATLASKHFAAWTVALKETPVADRMESIMPYLDEHHADAVARVNVRWVNAHGTRGLTTD